MSEQDHKKTVAERREEFRKLWEEIAERLSRMKNESFTKDGETVSDVDFEEISGVSRGSTPRVEHEPPLGLADLETIYLWVRACGATMADLFESHAQYEKSGTAHLHYHLEFILKHQGKDHFIAQGIEWVWDKLKPPQRRIKSPPKEIPQGMKPAEEHAQRRADKTPIQKISRR